MKGVLLFSSLLSFWFGFCGLIIILACAVRIFSVKAGVVWGIPFYGGDFDIYTAKAESVQNYSWYDQSGQGQIAGQGGEIHFFFLFPPSECIRKGGGIRDEEEFLLFTSTVTTAPKNGGGGDRFASEINHFRNA